MTRNGPELPGSARSRWTTNHLVTQQKIRNNRKCPDLWVANPSYRSNPVAAHAEVQRVWTNIEALYVGGVVCTERALGRLRPGRSCPTLPDVRDPDLDVRANHWSGQVDPIRAPLPPYGVGRERAHRIHRRPRDRRTPHGDDSDVPADCDSPM